MQNKTKDPKIGCGNSKPTLSWISSNVLMEIRGLLWRGKGTKRDWQQHHEKSNKETCKESLSFPGVPQKIHMDGKGHEETSRVHCLQVCLCCHPNE